MAKKKSDPALQRITWESVRRELNGTRTDQGQIDYDKVRRRKLAALAVHTKRPAVLYATDFLNEGKIQHAQNGVAINPQDVRGLAEVVRGLEGDAVDLILHSPGGSPRGRRIHRGRPARAVPDGSSARARDGQECRDNDRLGRERNPDADQRRVGSH